jgi:GAF domain-containing protein
MLDRSDTVERLHEAVISLERSRRRERELRAVQTGTADVVRVLALADHRHATFDTLLDALRRLLPFQEAAVLVRAGEGTFVPVVRTCDWLSGLRLGTGRMLARVLRGEIVVAFDASLIPEWQAQDAEVRARARSVIHVPLRAGDAPVLLVCTHSDSARFEQRHVDLVKSILPLAGRILERVDLHEVPTARERERRSRLAVLTSIVDHIHAGVLVEDDRRRVAAANDQLASIFGEVVAAPRLLAGCDAAALNVRLASLTTSPETFVARTSQLVYDRVPMAGDEIWLSNGAVVERDYTPVATPDAGFIAHFWQYRVSR